MDVGLNDPQVPAGAQLQVTPLAAVSLETVAVIVAVPLAARDGGGGVDRTTERPGMVTEALALLVPSVTEDAVIVTMPPDGEEAGAV